jgi:hypothetical protein
MIAKPDVTAVVRVSVEMGEDSGQARADVDAFLERMLDLKHEYTNVSVNVNEPVIPVVSQLGPLFVLHSDDGHWRWWCSDDNATSMGNILGSTPQRSVERMAWGHLRRYHKDVYQRLVVENE